MTNRTKIGALLLLAATAGCASSGLSYRERGRNTQASYLNSMYASGPASAGVVAGVEGATTQPTVRRPFSGPAVLAVAQVGETSPPEAMLQVLRDERALFSRIQSIPAADVAEERYFHRNGTVERDEGPRRQVDALRNLAAGTGADYLLLVGGTVDQATGSTPLSVLNLTIVGMFLVPSEHTRAVMKASGAMIDVRTGQLVTLASAERKQDTLTTYASNDAGVVRMLDGMRDRVTRDLAGKVIDACRADAAPAATARR